MDFADQRADKVILGSAVSCLQLPCFRDEHFHEVIGDVINDRRNGAGHTAFPAAAECRTDDALNSLFKMAIRHNNRMVFSAGQRLNAFPVGCARLIHIFCDRF